MDRISFRFLLTKMLHGKSEELVKLVEERVQKVLEISKQSYLSEESVAIITMTAEIELERVNREK